MSKSRLGAIAKRLDRAAPTAGNGWTVGYTGDGEPGQVVVDGQPMTAGQWADLDGDKILVIYEAEVNDGVA